MSGKRWAIAAIVAAAAFFAVQGGEYSTLDYIELRREMRAESLQVVSLERVVDSLAKVAEAVETDPKVQERIARERYGMIREGEYLYQLVEPAGGDPP